MFVEAINGQRKRLKNGMSEAEFRTWHAQSLCVFQSIPGSAHLQRRFDEIVLRSAPVPSKVGEARSVMTSLVQWVKSPLFYANPVPTHVPSQLLPGGLYLTTNVTQVQNVTQSITPDLETLLKRIDADASLPPEAREEAKTLTKSLWQRIVEGSRDMATFADIVVRLAALGANVVQILKGLQIGQ